MTKYRNETGQPAIVLVRKASTAFLRLRGMEMFNAHTRNNYEAKNTPTTEEVFFEGLRMGFEAAFLTILSLDETDNGEQVDGGPFGPGTVGAEAGVEMREPEVHKP